MVIWRILEQVRADQHCRLDFGIVACGIASRDELMLGQCFNSIRMASGGYAMRNLRPATFSGSSHAAARGLCRLNQLLLVDLASAVLDTTCAVSPLVALFRLALRLSALGAADQHRDESDGKIAQEELQSFRFCLSQSLPLLATFSPRFVELLRGLPFV
jgi:hypothetical protein